MSECKHRVVRGKVKDGKSRVVCQDCNEDVSDMKLVSYVMKQPFPHNTAKSIVEQLQREFVNLSHAVTKYKKYIEEAQKICQEYNLCNPGDDAVITVLKEFKRRN